MLVFVPMPECFVEDYARYPGKLGVAGLVYLELR